MTDLNQLPQEYVECRGPDRHMWGKSKPEPENNRLKKYPATSVIRRYFWECQNCDMGKLRIMNKRTGGDVAVVYFPPPGYKLTGRRKSAKDIRKRYMELTEGS